MAIPRREQITGLVLAGGRGERMGGVDKGLVEFKGKPLAAQVLERLAPQVATVLISANRNRERYAGLGVDVVADPADVEPFAGPLAGIRAAFEVVRTPWLAVVPCDTPQLPRDLVARLAAGVGAAKAAYAVAGGRSHGLCCLVHASLRESLIDALVQGERRVGGWLERVGATAVEFDDARAFANLNAAVDLDAAVLRNAE